MARPRNKRVRLVLLAAAVTAATVTLGAARSVSAFPLAGGSCAPISAGQLQSILGLSQSLQQMNHVDDSGGARTHLCNGVAWSGPAPTTFQGSLQLAKRGRGAAFGIETWHPNPASPDAARWPKDFEKMVASWVEGHVVWPGVLSEAGSPSHGLAPPPLGYHRTGIVVKPQGPATGLVAAVACWWDNESTTAVCLMNEEGASRPVVEHLVAMARIAVPKALG